MSARQEILDKLGSAVKNENDLDARRAVVAARISKHAKGIIPDVAKSPKAAIELFVEKAEAAEASVVRVSKKDIGKAITDYLREHNLPQALRAGDDARLKPVLKQLGKLVDVSNGRSFGDDLVGLSHAIGGVAETGTLLMVSGPENPTTLNFLPENHIVVVDEKDIETSYEAILGAVREKYGAGQMPRTVNMITGPSRSADIEQTLILGAHGPVRLHIIVAKG